MPRQKKFLACRALAASTICTTGMLAVLPAFSIFLWICCRSGDIHEGR